MSVVYRSKTCRLPRDSSTHRLWLDSRCSTVAESDSYLRSVSLRVCPCVSVRAWLYVCACVGMGGWVRVWVL